MTPQFNLEVFITTFAFGAEEHITVSLPIAVFMKNMHQFNSIPNGPLLEDQPNLQLIGILSIPTTTKTIKVYVDKASRFEDKLINNGYKTLDLNTIEDYKNIDLI